MLAGLIIAGAAVVGSLVYASQKKKEKEELEAQHERRERKMQKKMNHLAQKKNKVRVVKEVKTVTKVVKKDANGKKVAFFDLYRQIDGYLAHLSGASEYGVTRLINGYRNSNCNGKVLKKWEACRLYRNGLAHDRTKWINIPNPTPEAMSFLNQKYQEMKSNPRLYRNIMKSGLITKGHKSTKNYYVIG